MEKYSCLNFLSEDTIGDLLLYRRSEPQYVRNRFLVDAQRKIESGHHVFTHIKNGELMFCGWLMNDLEKEFRIEYGHAFSFKPLSVCLHAFYLHARFSNMELLKSLVLDMISAAGAKQKSEFLYFVVGDNESLLLNILRSIGAIRESSFYKKNIWGMIRRITGERLSRFGQ
jgi:hypothetical protein